ncbi:hypothetical protein [Wolbachia endosymbiont (group B) of Gerris lacustris]|uniref:WD_0033/WD_0034 family tandem repeat-containing protein n=1 Tax=Wolbachia endosymbiont (group B) of Gerris lacustris TaxID=3066159 RepID=UPI003341BB42
MLNHQNLTRKQEDLYFQLKGSIWNGRSISNILKAVSKNDLLKVLTTEYTTRFPRGGGRTLTLLSLTIHRNNNECVNSILEQAKNNGILQEIINTENIIHYKDDRSYTLTSLGFAIYENKERYVNAIFVKAQESGILQDILAARNIIKLNIISYALTPLSFSIYKGNNECINSILEQAQNNGMLQGVFVAEDIATRPLSCLIPTLIINEPNKKHCRVV